MHLIELIHPSTIAVDIEVQNWQQAIREAGKLLVEDHAVTPRFVDAMIRMADEYGPYFVIAPGIALPHARPEDGVNKTGISIVRLKHPVKFGNPDNDPVFLVIALAAADKDQHVEALAELAKVLGNGKTVGRIKACKDQMSLISIFTNDVQAGKKSMAD